MALREDQAYDDKKKLGKNIQNIIENTDLQRNDRRVTDIFLSLRAIKCPRAKE